MTITESIHEIVFLFDLSKKALVNDAHKPADTHQPIPSDLNLFVFQVFLINAIHGLIQQVALR